MPTTTMKRLLQGVLRAAPARPAAPAPAEPRPGFTTPEMLLAHDPTRAAGDDRRAFWDEMFAVEDPWDYACAYEQVKYERTLALLPHRPIGTALELACAEGRFTLQLAPRVSRLLATDISPRAVERTRRRCRGLRNVRTAELDFLSDRLPMGLDLIVCSEVLYYLNDRDRVAEVGARLRDALAPGGLLLTAHAFLLADRPDQTGFDWDHPYGAETIAAAFAGTPGLRHERCLRTPVYRIDLFSRADDPGDGPVIEEAPVGAEIDPEVERWLVWGGCTARRKDLARQTTDRVPVLRYTRVPDGFAEQIRRLRGDGRHSVTSAVLARHLRDAAPLRGRPVLISFDGGRRDLLAAWELLQRRDFGLEVFLSAAHVAGDGDPAELLTWAEIRAMAGQGVGFGLRLDRRPSLTGETLVETAARLGEAMQTRFGAEPVALALDGAPPPEAELRALSHAGWRAVYVGRDGPARIGDDPLALPRITVGAESPDAFAARVSG